MKSKMEQSREDHIRHNESIRRRAISVVYNNRHSDEDCADLILMLGLEKPASEWYDFDFRPHLPKGSG